jgi:hypothetical protein
MSKRMTVIALLLVAMAVPLAPIAKAHGGDDADVMRLSLLPAKPDITGRTEWRRSGLQVMSGFFAFSENRCSRSGWRRPR